MWKYLSKLRIFDFDALKMTMDKILDYIFIGLNFCASCTCFSFWLVGRILFLLLYFDTMPRMSRILLVK